MTKAKLHNEVDRSTWPKSGKTPDESREMPCRRGKQKIVWCGIAVSIWSSLLCFLQRSPSYNRGHANFNPSNRLTVPFDNVRNKRQAAIMVSDVFSSCSQLNFSFPSVVVEPSVSGQESNLFMFVLITSGVGGKFFSEKRDAIRNTWLNKSGANVWWRHAFVLGSADNRDGPSENEIQREAELYNDILQFSSIDKYNNLVIKVLSGFRWAVTQVNPRFILKADDDVYVRIPHLMLWLTYFGKGQFYGGHVNNGGIYRKFLGPLVARFSGRNSVSFDCYPEARFPQYSAGPFYVLSSDAMISLLQNMRRWKVFPVEDAYVGVLARDSGLKPVGIPGFKINDYRRLFCHRCTLNSLVAVGHQYSISDLYYIESKLREADKLNLSTNICLCFACEILTHPFLFVFTCFGVVFTVIVKIIRRKRNLLNYAGNNGN